MMEAHTALYYYFVKHAYKVGIVRTNEQIHHAQSIFQTAYILIRHMHPLPISQTMHMVLLHACASSCVHTVTVFVLRKLLSNGIGLALFQYMGVSI